MLRSMFAAVSGLRSHQTMMDVIGNNIANVNTVGYKSASAEFQDLLSQMLKGAGGPQNGLGGSNPAQIGIGTKVGAITTSFTQGALQQTGRTTDLAIQGDGFFVADNGGQRVYTRAGSLSFDVDGRLVTPDGAKIQGWSADPTGAIDTNQEIGGIALPPGQTIAPAETQNVKLGGNLPADAVAGTTISTSISVYDKQGTQTPVNFDFVKTATANQWTVQPKNAAGANLGAPTTVTFNAATGQPSITGFQVTPPGQWDANGVHIDFGPPGDASSLVQFSGSRTLSAINQDGSPLGSLQSFAFSPTGLITGVFSNGQNKTLAQVALASFNNPMGLEKAGSSLYRETVNSGLPQIGQSGTNGRGLLATGTVEMSNVDLGQEFTNMIVAQRGFQANARVITASDELLQDLVNLKR
jgi:flagellar hook protein FlgE